MTFTNPFAPAWLLYAIPLGVLFLLCVLYAVLSGVLAHRAAKRKGYGGYFWTGFLLGVLGVAYVAGLPDKYGMYERQSILRKLDELQQKLPQIEKR